MATGLGQTFRKNLYDHIFRATTDPTAATYYVSLHTADPGTDGASASTNEVTGGSYARVSVTAGTGAFSATTGANPNVIANNAAINFPTATGSWGTITYFGLWTSSSLQTPAAYVGRGTITSQSIVSGNSASFASGALQMTVNET